MLLSPQSELYSLHTGLEIKLRCNRTNESDLLMRIAGVLKDIRSACNMRRELFRDQLETIDREKSTVRSSAARLAVNKMCTFELHENVVDVHKTIWRCKKLFSRDSGMSLHVTIQGYRMNLQP